MRRRALLAGLLSAALPAPAFAQQAGKVAHIGLLLPSLAVNGEFAQYFRDGMRELGWEEGRNWVFETRAYGLDLEAVPGATAQLVRAKVDVIVVVTLQVAIAAQPTAGTIPILVAAAGDPVRVGAAVSLARPGGTITGLATMSPDLAAKRVEQIKEMLPQASRLAILRHPDTPVNALMLDAILPATQKHRLIPRTFDVRSGEDIESAFDAIKEWSADAVIVLDAEPFFRNRSQLAAAAMTRKLPIACGFREMTRAGCLFSYATNILEHFRRGAAYVDKILKGTKPGDLPFEQPTRFELVINLKTAKSLGIEMPRTLLAIADEVIE